MDFISPRAVYLTVLSVLLPTLPSRLWPGTQAQGSPTKPLNGSGDGMVKHRAKAEGEVGRETSKQGRGI